MADIDPEIYYKKNIEIIGFLSATLGQPDLVLETEDRFKRCLIMTVTGYFEKRFKIIIENYCARKGNILISNYIRERSLQNYHRLFNFKETTINSFLGYFGVDFKKAYNLNIEDKPELQSGIELFMELGRWRNEMAHGKFSNLNITATSSEIFEKYTKVKIFIDDFDIFLHNYLP